MAVIFRIEHKSDQGRDYKMEIIDNDGGTFIGDMIVNSDGFRLQDTGDNKKFHQTIIGKAVSFTIQVTNNDIEAFILSLTTSDEGRYACKLYLNNEIIFIGVITTDSVTIDNAPKPYDFKLEAVDGIKLLRNIPYKSVSIPSLSRSIEQHLMMALKDVPTASQYGISDNFCSFALNWWSREHINESQDSGSVLAKTYVQNFTFTKNQNPDDNFLDAEFLDCLSVIEAILNAFNCRIYYDYGYYHVEQYGIRDQISYEEIVYNISDNLVQYDELSVNTVTPGVNIDQENNFQLAGGKIKLLPPLRSVDVTYNLNENFDFLSGRPPINFERTQGLENIGEFIVTSEKDTMTIILGGDPDEGDFVSYVLNDPNALTIDNYQVCFKLRLRVGFNSLTNEDGELEWVDSATNPGVGVILLVYNDFDPFYIPVDQYELGKVMTLSEHFTSPEVTTGGDVFFDLYPVFRQYDSNSNEWDYFELSDLPVDPEYLWGFGRQKIIQTVDGQVSRKIPRITRSEQDAGTAGISREILISDGLGVNRPGNMSIKDASGTYIRTTGWRIGDSTVPTALIDHSKLLAQTILSERKKVLRIYQGTLYAKTDLLTIGNTFNYDGYDLITNKTKSKTNYDEITTELIEISIDTTNITNIEIEEQAELGEEVGNGTGGGGTGGGSGGTGDPNVTDPPNIGNSGLITSEVIYANVAITQVPILEADDDYFVTGDKIIIKDNVSGYEHNVTVAAPLLAGETTITIESFTPDRNIAIYSAVTFAPGQLLNLRPKYELFPNASGNSVTVTKFDLPDEVSLSDSEMSRRLRVYRQTSKLIYNVGFTVDSTNNKINFEWDLNGEYVEVELL